MNGSFETIQLTDPEPAGLLLREDKLVAFPTETVFGLGAVANSASAVARLFEAKGRPSDNPLIVHLADHRDWQLAAIQLTPTAEVLFHEFSPGPISIVLPKQPSILPEVTAGLDSVAIRIPSCPLAREVIRSCGLPIAAPSANISGKPSATCWEDVWEDLAGRIDAVLCLNSAEFGLESTVVDCCGEVPIILRSGAITLSAIRRYFPQARMLDTAAKGEQANSPGLRHKHYQPNARVILFEAENAATELADVAQARSALACLSEYGCDRNEDWLVSRQYKTIE
ncbi:MAG: L-threonylcarbamoyladenylate synthase, partial [Planctomycetota bacterium]